MPFMKVRGANIQYEVLGEAGRWLALSPGGRRDMSDVRSLAELMQKRGFRVLIHDRRNCGLSDISIDSTQPEYEVWADDLAVILDQIGAQSAIVGGGSSGCRLSLLFASKYPQRVDALLLFRITGGQFAANRLAKRYYSDYIDAARTGGMRQVCETDHFKTLIELKPSNRDLLMAMDAGEFIAAMVSWRAQFIAGSDQPVIGATTEQLRSLKVPTCIIPGNDKTHNHAVAYAAAGFIAESEVYDLFPGDNDVDIVPMTEWAPREDEIAGVFAEFVERRLRTQP